MEEESINATEKILAETNQDDVALIADGLTRQHFIEIDSFIFSKGKLYESQVKNEWNIENQEEDGNEEKDPDWENNDIFATEVNDKMIQEARSRIISRLSGLTATVSSSNLDKALKGGIFDHKANWYVMGNGEIIKQEILARANLYYEKSLNLYENGEYDRAIINLNKAFSYNSLNIQFYLLRFELFVSLCDFKSALLTLNKLNAILSIYVEDGDATYDDLKRDILDKSVFCHFMCGQTYYDSGLFLDALDSFNKTSELKPQNLLFKVKSISCLYAMNRCADALDLLNKLFEEREEYKNNANLFILKARINLKENNITNGYYDLKQALIIENDNKEALNLIEQLKEAAENLRNNALILGLSNRVLDGITKMTSAISFNPEKPEFHLQRGILYRRQKDFNSAIDDLLLGLEKIKKLKESNPELESNIQRQILLTYNEFAIQCYEKKFYDDAIVLLNKAIKAEKNEKGFYINRGDCFYQKNEKQFALLDYEQAYEIDAKDEKTRNRIANVYYEFAIEKYNEKKYEDATQFFDKAIRYAPSCCKYYISRARTLYFCQDFPGAQRDICISILLDPTNQEIPTIISKIFSNKDLNDVLNSEQMKIAQKYLDYLKIENVFDVGKTIKSNLKLEKETKSKNSKFTNEYTTQEAENNLKLIEEKKEINRKLKNVHHLQLKDDKPKLTGVVETFDREKRVKNKEINWRKFKNGIGSLT